MDLDFDDQPIAAPPGLVRSLNLKGRPQPKRKQLPLSTQTQDPVSSLHASSSASPNTVSVSETIVPDPGTINQSAIGTISKEEGFMVFVLDDSMLEFPPDRTQDSTTFGDFVVTRETDNTETQRTHRGEEEEEDCHWNMETLEAEGITSAYEQHTGKLQPKPRLLGTVIEEPDSDDYTTRATNHDVESRNDESNTNTTFSRELQEAEEDNIPQVPRETVHGGCEDEQHVVSTSTKNTVIGEKEETQSGRESKKGKSKRARKGKATTSQEEEEPNSKAPEEKKLKHSSRRQRNRTLDKELLETPDDDIKHLPIKDMLPLFEYRNWLEKKKAKGAPALPPAQESNTNAWEDNQYYSQGFDAEDEFGMVETENQEINVVKPDSPVNYQTYMNKTPRTRWSKQDTQLFYEGIRDFGSDLSMVQQLSFPERTRQQIKLKFKSEERKFPLKLNEALSTRSKDLVRCHNLIKKLQQKAAAARDGEEEEAGKEAETTIDVPENEEPAKSEGAGDGVKESEGGDEYEDNDDDDDFWNSYKSEM